MIESKNNATLDSILTAPRQVVMWGLNQWLVEDGTDDTLANALRYCTAGGKRLRGSLTILSAEALTGETCETCESSDLVKRAAVAIELIHAYSLAHDDLPSMDNDTLRRGKPTAHVKFSPAMAILAGDALLTRAFGLLAESDDPKVGALIKILARSAGGAGMIAGQVADMGLCQTYPSLDAIEYIHHRKTGDLISAATQIGAFAAGGSSKEVSLLGQFGLQLGLAFQLVDDILDVTGNSETIGKTPGKDIDAGKMTHIAVLGMDKSKLLLEKLTKNAIDTLNQLGARADKLKSLTYLLTNRTH